MAITTSQMTITSSWQKVSDSDCTIQSLQAGVLYDFVVGTSTPTTAFLYKTMDTPTTLAYKTPVWLRLHSKGSSGNQQIINIIK